MSHPKSTSYAYGHDSQLRLLAKYRNREDNHWRIRIQLAKDLVEQYVLPRLKTKSKGNIVVVDVGCSIGTFAVEFAKSGYRCFGIDFDSSAIEIAARLAAEENVAPEFVCGDISDWRREFPPIDIAVCFDIFEHLHDDELGAFLSGIRRHLSADGALVFHTYPTQYDHIFHWRGHRSWALLPLAKTSQAVFGRVVRVYSCLFDAALALLTGKTYRERIKRRPHCNPISLERLSDILRRMGYDLLFIETANLYGGQSFGARWFRNQPITFRNLYGVAVLKPARD